MKAQIYPEDDPIVRLFEIGNDYGIADLTVRKGSPREADAALRKMRLRRKEPWQKTDWGWEARIAFCSNTSLDGRGIRVPSKQLLEQEET